MSFETELERIVGAATDSHDIRAVVRRCFFYDFDGYPTRLWDGQGVLTTTGGVKWYGTIDASGGQNHTAPVVRDPRDGASPRYEFSLPYVDKATFDGLKADQNLAKGRQLDCYHAIFNVGEGLLPQTPLRFAYRLIIREVLFSHSVEQYDGHNRHNMAATVVARSLEFGRSKMPNGVMNDTAQRERARLLGVASDSGCSFVASNAVRTFRVAGG